MHSRNKKQIEKTREFIWFGNLIYVHLFTSIKNICMFLKIDTIYTI